MGCGLIMNNYIEAGKVTSTRGLKGEVNVQSWCNTPKDLCKFKDLFLDSSGFFRIYTLSARVVGEALVVFKFRNIDTINDAKGLVNKVLYASRQDIKLEDGEYLISDIIGLKVVNCNNLNEVYGRVNDVIKCCNRPDLYEVLLESGKKVLIPAVEEIVRSKSINEGVVRVFPLEGIFDNVY